MAGWSIMGNGVALDCLEILQSLQTNGFCLNFDLSSLKMSKDDNKVVRELFDQILTAFLKEISINEVIRPLPAVLGNGQCVDLFRLFRLVRERGGYDLVSKNGKWGSVSEEIGLSLGVASSVKLFHFKYLNTLDRWIRIYLKDKGKEGAIRAEGCDGDLGLLPVGLGTQFKDFLSKITDQKRVNEEISKLNKKKGEARSVTELGRGKKGGVDDDEDVAIVDKSVVKMAVFSRKRKRETLSGMLNWVTEIAKNPSDSAIAKLAEAYRQNQYGSHELRNLVLKARRVMFQRQDVNYADEIENLLFQKKQKMDLFVDESQLTVAGRLRFNPTIPPLRNGVLDPFYDSFDLDISTTLAGIEEEPSLNPFYDDRSRKGVPIGQIYQAEVPEWNGSTLESDSKWLGKIDWPLKTEKEQLAAERVPIGKGRQDSCDCRLPGSVECVRFHIAEKKIRLKSELGLVFYAWRFHVMGEEVSLSWTQDEEKKFKATVRLNAPFSNKCFWTQLNRCFRTKGWNSLVSYYFNVFVLQRRAYQNRVTPNNIDSDDDESEVGSITNGFRLEAVKVPGFRSIACARNYQCSDLE